MQRVDPTLIDWDVQQGCMCERAERREEEGRNNYGGEELGLFTKDLDLFVPLCLLS